MTIDGVVVVDKPAGCTSHDVVGRCRRIFGQKKVGHGGTLDPDATGVLVVGLGRATRLLRFLAPLPKSYVAEVVLGVATTTLDDARRGGGHLRHGRRGAGRRAGGGGAVRGRHRADPAHGVGRVGRGPAPARAGPGRRSRSSGRPGRSRSTASRWTPASEPGVVPDRGRLLVGHLRAHAGRRPGRRPGRRAPTCAGSGARPSAPSSTGVALDDLGADHVLPPAAAVGHLPPVTADAGLAEAVSYGKVLDVGLGRRGARGPCSTTAAPCWPSTSATPDGRTKPAVVLAPH